jgi:thiol:disulfide interchange protein DsbC
MKLSTGRLLALIVFVITPSFVFSAESGIESDSIKSLKNALSIKLPGLEITQVKETPIQGVFEVVVGAQIVYTDGNARYAIDGDLIDLATKRNFTEESRAVIRLMKIEDLGEKNMIVYTPETVNHTITVVTDINCPYCRRLHGEMDEYMTSGVKVRYIFMPLKGKDDYDTTVSVWCSDDKNLALDLAKAGSKIEKASCDNPIQRHLNLARQIGVRGTPAIILENGAMLPGYVPVKKMVKRLNTLRSASKS